MVADRSHSSIPSMSRNSRGEISIEKESLMEEIKEVEEAPLQKGSFGPPGRHGPLNHNDYLEPF